MTATNGTFSEDLASDIADEMLGINCIDAPIYLQLQMKAVILEGIQRYCGAIDLESDLQRDTRTVLEKAGLSLPRLGPVQ